jgi:hypothetical protein
MKSMNDFKKELSEDSDNDIINGKEGKETL